MSTPASVINICSGVRLDSNYTHTVWFPDMESQTAWFESKVVKRYTGYTYLRKSWSIKVDATDTQHRNWTYLFFTNNTKTYYYFINRIEYISDSVVELFLELDVMQTYMFNYEMANCFVEREHAASDEIGENIVEEGLELGEYVSISDADVDLNDWLIMVLAVTNPATAVEMESDYPYAYHYSDHVFSGLGLYCASVYNAYNLSVLMNQLNEKGILDIVVAMWMYPGELVETADALGNNPVAVSKAKKIEESYTRNTALADGYKPRNKKLFCYPYNFLYVTNNNGAGNAYPYEYFGDPVNPVFKLVGTVSPDAAVTMYPLNYKGSQHNYESGLTLSNFPTCAWDSDIYKMWLAQTRNERTVSGVVSGLGVVGGAAMAIGGAVTYNPALIGSGVATAFGSAASIANQLAQKADKSIMPPEARGNFSSSVNMTAGFQTFTVRKKCITANQAKRLDEYFDMYGYKTMRLKKPNRHVRENWTYTKTAGCVIYGNVADEDRRKIESIYDKGITIWTNGDYIGRYELSNACL